MSVVCRLVARVGEFQITKQEGVERYYLLDPVMQEVGAGPSLESMLTAGRLLSGSDEVDYPWDSSAYVPGSSIGYALALAGYWEVG